MVPNGSGGDYCQWMELPQPRAAAKRWLVVAAVSIAVAAVGAFEARTAWDDWALLLGAVAVGVLVSTIVVWLFFHDATPQTPRPLGRWATVVMIVAIASVPFWEDSDTAPLLFGAAAGFVARTVIRFRRWPT